MEDCRLNARVGEGPKAERAAVLLFSVLVVGQIVPRDKAKRSTRRVSLVDYALAKELRQKGTYIASSSDTRFYCVSCAVHRGIVKVRAEKERHMRISRPRRF